MSEAPEPQTSTRRTFGTFAGVYRPVFLGVVGGLLYLREGWLVGNSGLLGALLIIGLSVAISGTTALSLASIASNVRVRPGGAFAIIAQALGLEAGGAIGLPLFIAQAASSAMYAYAFSEAWGHVFPAHPPQLVAFLAFGALALLAWRSAGVAFRAQAVMFVVVCVALTSALLGLFSAETLHPPTLLGHTTGEDLVTAFAIFFPAATGIMVGVGMSGDLRDPRRSIPRGTLWAWGTTSVIYLGFAFFYSAIGSPEELVAHRTIIIDRALFPPLVLAGLMASTLMAALSALVTAPRLLQAMAAHGVVPGARWLGRLTPEGEPRNAVLATTALAATGLAAGSLNAIAPLITSFFIMTYLAINGVVYVEIVLGMISFRPTFRVGRTVPLVGVGLCLLGLAVGSPFGGVLELALVLGVYLLLARRSLATPWETVRSGIAVNLAAWAARRASRIERSERAWKPDLLVPVASIEQARDMRPWVEDLARRNGSIRWVALGPREDLPAALPALVDKEREGDLHATWTRLETDRYMEGLGLAMDALQGALFPPNLVAVDLRRVSDGELALYLDHCRRLSVGLLLWQPHPQGGIGARRAIDVWISDRAPQWRLELHVTNLDLPVLVGLLLAEAWQAELRLCTSPRDPADAAAAEAFLRAVVDQARLPRRTTVHVLPGPFAAALTQAPPADLHLFGMPPALSRARLDEVAAACQGSCLWLLDSGHESALA